MNKIIITGRLTCDPEMRKSTNGESFATFCVAVYYNKEHTDFINCIAFKNTADFINQYFKKGHLIGISGRLQNRMYVDNFGQKKYVYEIVVETVDLLQSKNESNAIDEAQKLKDQAVKDFDNDLNDISNDPEMPWNQ